MSLTEDLLDIQKNIGSLPKSGKNPHFKNRYVPLDVLMDKLMPMLHEKGILLLQPLTALAPAVPAISTRFVKGDEMLEWTTPLVLGKDDPQGHGSAITYCRRYALFATLGLVGDDDDDGNASAKLEKKEQATSTQSADGKPPF